MKNKLVTLKEAYQCLSLEPSSRYFDELLQGKSPKLKAINFETRTAKNEALVFYLDDVMSAVFNDNEYERYLKKLAQQKAMYRTSDQLTKIFKISKGAITNAMNMEKIDTLDSELQGAPEKFTDIEFAYKSKLKNLINTKTNKTRKYLLSKPINDIKLFKATFTSKNGILPIVKMTNDDSQVEEFIDFSFEDANKLRMYVFDNLPLVMIRFNDKHCLNVMFDEEYQGSLIQEKGIILPFLSYTAKHEDVMNIFDYLVTRGSFEINVNTQQIRYGGKGQEDIAGPNARTLEGTTMLPENISWSELEGFSNLLALYAWEKSQKDGSAEISYAEIKDLLLVS